MIDPLGMEIKIFDYPSSVAEGEGDTLERSWEGGETVSRDSYTVPTPTKADGGYSIALSGELKINIIYRSGIDRILRGGRSNLTLHDHEFAHAKDAAEKWNMFAEVANRYEKTWPSKSCAILAGNLVTALHNKAVADMGFIGADFDLVEYGEKSSDPVVRRDVKKAWDDALKAQEDAERDLKLREKDFNVWNCKCP